jgi:hypothetical protein
MRALTPNRSLPPLELFMLDAAAQFPASTTSGRQQPSSPAVMNGGLAQRLVKCRYYVQRLLRLSLAHVLLQDNA